jgi:hypothetical protein
MKELTAMEWQEELDRALEFRQIYGGENKWAKIEKLFYNRDESNAHAGPNLIMATGDALLSSLSVPWPYIRQTEDDGLSRRRQDGAGG